MKLQELFEMIEKENKFNKFMNSIEENVVRLDEYGYYDKDFKTLNEFVKEFNNEFEGEINKETKLYNEKGYIKFDVTYNQKDWSEEKGVYLTPKTETYNIYIETIQVWN